MKDFMTVDYGRCNIRSPSLVIRVLLGVKYQVRKEYLCVVIVMK